MLPTPPYPPCTLLYLTIAEPEIWSGVLSHKMLFLTSTLLLFTQIPPPPENAVFWLIVVFVNTAELLETKAMPPPVPNSPGATKLAVRVELMSSAAAF